MPVPSTNGNKYIMTFIDHCTRMCWVCLLKYKPQAFETFKKFHVWIENEAQSRISTLHTDNGGEYTSNEFHLHQHGNKHQTIVPYNPRRNVVVERMNMVRSMLFFKNVKLMQSYVQCI